MKGPADAPWGLMASDILKAELKRKRMNYTHLVAALKKIGIEETHCSIRNKMARKTFTAAFFLQALTAIGAKRIQISAPPVASPENIKGNSR